MSPALPSLPSPPFIALSQFFVPQPHVLFLLQGCAHMYCDCTNSLQRICVTCPQQALCSDFSSLPGQGQGSGIDQKLKTSSKPDHQESVDSLLLTANPQQKAFLQSLFRRWFHQERRRADTVFLGLQHIFNGKRWPIAFHPSPQSMMLFLFSRNTAALENRSLPLSVRIQCPI